MRIGVISNSDNFIPLVGALVHQKAQVSLFYAPSPDDFVNRKVAAFVRQTNLPYCQEADRSADLYRWLYEGLFEACFIIGYGRLIDNNKAGKTTQLFNIHFGPLPAFGGPLPVFWQLRQGADKIGLAIHQVDEKFDNGPVWWLKEIPNLPHYNFMGVMQLFSHLCVEGVFFVLGRLLGKWPLNEAEEKQTTPSYHKRPGLTDVSVEWDNMTAREICNLIRACNPWNKGAITFFHNQEVKLMDARITDGQSNEAPGTLTGVGDALYIACKSGDLLSVSMLYYHEAYYPAWALKELGFQKGNRMENIRYG